MIADQASLSKAETLTRLDTLTTSEDLVSKDSAISVLSLAESLVTAGGSSEAELVQSLEISSNISEIQLEDPTESINLAQALTSTLERQVESILTTTTSL